MSRIVFLIIVALFCAVPVHAQVDTTAASRVQQLPPGTLVRVLYDSREVIGHVRSVSGDTLVVDSTALSLSSITRLQLRGRAARKGLKIGAIAGAPAGAAFGAFVFLIGHALCEYECGDGDVGYYLTGTLGGAAFGTLAGGLIGATIGAAIPRWVDIGKARARSNNENVGSISLTPAYGHASGAAGGGLGLRASYMFQTKHVGFGPELGHYGTGDLTRSVYRYCPENGSNAFCQDPVTFNQKVSHLGGIARIGLGSDHAAEPYATIGTGIYSWTTAGGGSIQFGGYSAGVGILAHNTSHRRSAFIDARYHNNLTRSGEANPQYGFFTIGLGGALAW